MANVKELNINNTNYDIIGKGVVNQNTSETNPLKYWTGTASEYENLQTIDTDTVYVIKDNYTPANVETLFDFKFSDHLIDNICWVNADNYDWVDGTRYTSAYQHLVDDFTDAQAEQGQLDIQNDTIVPTYSETIGSYTIYYYLAHDEHKIIMPDQATTAENIYAESGISWYYLLDTGNSRFKLPRTKHGFVGYRTAPGENADKKLMGTGYPNITTTGRTTVSADTDYTLTENSWVWWGNTSYTGLRYFYVNGIEIGHSYGASGTWEEFNSMLIPLKKGDVIKHTGGNSKCYIYPTYSTNEYPIQMLLYFYVGNQVINQDMIDVNAINTELTNKADKDLSNVDSNIDYVIETQAPTSANSYTWYRLYKSGWVEQGGEASGSSEQRTVTLPIEMSNAHYGGFVSYLSAINSAEWTSYTDGFTARTTTTITFNTKNSVTRYWEVRGFAAQS